MSQTPQFRSYGRGTFPGHDVMCFLHEIVLNECKRVNITNNGRNGTYSGGGEEKCEKNTFFYIFALTWLQVMTPDPGPG